ncbi:MAG: ankyrin repeat domain-containing protein [Treponemataceae bacterium]|nr:ankyrin repeat domain-containing protein [Treponemataceae bacterium]
MKRMGTARKLAIAVAVCMAVLCLPGYSEPTPEQIAERTKLLFEAVKNDDVEWVKLLINHGAYVNARVGNGETILMYAISRDVADVLIKAGADVNAKSNRYQTALFFARNRGKNDIVNLLRAAGATE